MTTTASSATSLAPAWRPRRLAPGVHVVPRDDDHLQVGLDAPARVIVRREPDLVSALRDLRRGRPVAAVGPAVAGLVDALDAAGLLVEDGADIGRGVVSRGRSVRLVDRGFGLGPLTRLLSLAGVGSPDDGAAADLLVVAAPGPLPRDELDDWVRDGVPHLVLAGAGPAGSLRIGPLVEPGVTACLRCVDAAEAGLDPRRPLVLDQLTRLPPAPVDPLLAALALAWTAREVASFVAGDRPLTWSASIDLAGPAPVVRSWQRHPHCGCAWDAIAY